jgi:methionyl-tRNA formyltransferase
MCFEEIYILGTGTIAIDVFMSLNGFDNLCVLLFNEPPSSHMSYLVKRKRFGFLEFNTHEHLSAFLSTISNQALIISVNNLYLFPPEVIRKNNLYIINFHNSLLPAHKGVNAPSWSIFNQETITGVTWHRVTSVIDSGDILIQRKVTLHAEETSLNLVRTLMSSGVKAFEQIKQPLLSGALSGQPMPFVKYPQIHYRKDVPNNGLLDLSWPAEKISAFLRAMDWGRTGVFPWPSLTVKEIQYVLVRYKIVPRNPDEAEGLNRIDNHTMVLVRDHLKFILNH